MTIKARLVAIAAIVVSLIAVSILAQQVAGVKNEHQSTQNKVRYLSYLLANEFRQTSMDLTRLCRTFVATGDSRYWDAYWNIVKWRNGELPRPSDVDEHLYPGERKKQSDIMRELQFSDREFALLGEASNNSNALIATEDQAMRSIREGKVVDGPFQPLPGEGVADFARRIVFDANYHTEVSRIMTPVGSFFKELDNRTASQLQDAQQDASLWLSIAAACQILVALTIGGLLLFVMRAVFTPLNNVVKAMLNISEGDRDLTQRLDAEGDNEISNLGRGFNEFADNIQSLVLQIRETMDEITSSSSQMSTTARETDTAIGQQRQGIEALLSAIADLVPAIREIADNAVQAKQQADSSDTEASNGRRVVDQAVDNIQQLSVDIDNAAGVVDSLEQDTDSIGSVLDVIRGIADQTNLLALNAAIEAARAGEQGRGFAVVADEVRSLAQRTQDSTAEIQNMIERLQEGAKNAVSVMEQSRNRAEICVENTTQAGQSLVNIAESVKSINDVNACIAAASEQQNATIEEIHNTIDLISEQVAQTSQGSEQTAQSSEHTLQLTKDVNNLMKQFVI